MNYTREKKSEEPVTLQDIYRKCKTHFIQILTLPSKENLAKIIKKLFGIASLHRYKGKSRYAVFELSEHIASEPVQLTEKLHIPRHCSVTKIENELKISYRTDFIINSKQVSFCITFKDGGKISITFFNLELTLRFPLEPTQRNVAGLLHSLDNVKLCKGIKQCNLSKSKIIKCKSITEERCQRLLTDENEIRFRSKSCKIILSVYATLDKCETCHTFERQCRKRKLQDITNIQNENTSKQSETAENFKKETDTTGCDDIILNEDDDINMSQIFNKIIHAGSPKEFEVLLKSQLRNTRVGLEKHQRRWDPKVISMSLALYCRSPQAYQDVSQSGMLLLPSKRLLQYYKNSVSQHPGINVTNFEWMKKESDRKGISDFGKKGGLLLDEMSIQEDLQIVRKGDAWHIVGAVDMGEVNNNIDILINKEKKVKMATHCLQFVFHGFTGFRWPVAYYGSETATGYQINVAFWEVLEKLHEYGFTVDYVNLDGASTNRLFMNMLIPGNGGRDCKFMALDIFNSKHKICLIQDIKHVIKKIRNNVESSRYINKSGRGRYLMIDSTPVLWDHWQDAFRFNIQDGFPIHKNLTEEHINLTPAAKMRNSLASDVLNHEMLYLMKAYQATLRDTSILTSTVKFIENTSILVDIFLDHRPISNVQDLRLLKLKRVLELFNQWESNVSECADLSPAKHLMTTETRDDLNSSITGFISLCELVVGNGSSVNPGFLNSDLIENHFCQQRGIRNGLTTNPTLAQFGPAQTAICLGQTSVSSKCNSGTRATFYKATTPCPLKQTGNKNRTTKQLRH